MRVGGRLAGLFRALLEHDTLPKPSILWGLGRRYERVLAAFPR